MTAIARAEATEMYGFVANPRSPVTYILGSCP